MSSSYDPAPLVELDHDHQWSPWFQSAVFIKGVKVRTCLKLPCEKVEYRPEPPWMRKVRKSLERKKHGRS